MYAAGIVVPLGAQKIAKILLLGISGPPWYGILNC
jgi:hypothetical protein